MTAMRRTSLTAVAACGDLPASPTHIPGPRAAAWDDGSHEVGLDKAITTMRETGRDMEVEY